MRVDLANPFQSFILGNDEEEVAVAVNPLTIMYLQNKLAIYAAEMLKLGEASDVDPDPAKQMAIVSKLVIARARVQMLQEIIGEFVDGTNVAYERQKSIAAQNSQT